MSIPSLSTNIEHLQRWHATSICKIIDVMTHHHNCACSRGSKLLAAPCCICPSSGLGGGGSIKPTEPARGTCTHTACPHDICTRWVILSSLARKSALLEETPVASNTQQSHMFMPIWRHGLHIIGNDKFEYRIKYQHVDIITAEQLE